MDLKYKKSPGHIQGFGRQSYHINDNIQDLTIFSKKLFQVILRDCISQVSNEDTSRLKERRFSYANGFNRDCFSYR